MSLICFRADAGSVLPVVEAVPDPESEVCSICLEEYTPAFAPVTLRCHHAFHDVRACADVSLCIFVPSLSCSFA